MSITLTLLVLVPVGIIAAIAASLFTNNAINYFMYLKALENDEQDPRYCDGTRCICSDLMCISKEEREKDFLFQNLMAAAFLGTSVVVIFLYAKHCSFGLHFNG
jgi:hypothetical protein